MSDWTRSNVFFTLAEEPIITSVHILGDIDDQTWLPDAGTKMEYDPETELYTATIYVWADATFGFSTELDMDDLGGWNYLIPYRFGPANDDSLLELTEEHMGQQLPLAFVSGYGDIKVLSDGFYEVIVSLEQNYVKIGKVGELPHGYVKGDVNHDNQISIADVTTLIDLLLGGNDTACEICSDVNEDNAVSIADVTTLIDILLGAN